MDPRIQPLIELLTEHQPRDPKEHGSRHETLTALERLTQPFSEFADATHVTTSAIVVSTDQTVVLHKHKRLGFWMQPGGHVEGAETLTEAVLREFSEETGLVADVLLQPPIFVHVDAHDGGRGHRHLDIRYVLHVESQPNLDPGAGESREIGWFSLEQAAEMTDASCMSAVTAAIELLGGAATL